MSMLAADPLSPSLSSNGAGASCAWCARVLVASTDRLSDRQATRDHVWPRALRRKTDDDMGRRLVWCCRACNTMKGDMTPDQWQRFIAATPAWWTTPVLGRHRAMLKRYYGSDHGSDIQAEAHIAAIALWRRLLPPDRQPAWPSWLPMSKARRRATAAAAVAEDTLIGASSTLRETAAE